MKLSPNMAIRALFLILKILINLEMPKHGDSGTFCDLKNLNKS